ncbi:MAG: serine/threonine-protein phosphatase [Clostridia bacterium]|nr:serine/threonine-protein phosphatase [Clostridia bacterium]
MKAYADSHVGLVREENQDVCRLSQVAGGILALVLDGVGGAAGGRIAAEIAGDKFAACFTALCEESKEKKAAFTAADIHRLFSHAVYAANNAVFERGIIEPALAGMATTLTAVYLTAGEAFVANVGDSRAYLLSAGKITRLTHDHSLVQEEIDRGRITEEEARASHIKNVITVAVGIAPYVDFHFASHAVSRGDRLLVSTDGLTSYFPDSELLAIAASEKEPKALVKRYIQEALQRGGADNVTAVVMQV